MKSSKIIENHFKDLLREPIFNLGITVGLIEKDNIYEWNFTMIGPKDTPYKDALFILKIKFPKDFPLHAPSIYFVTPIYHVNVNSDSESGLPLGLVEFDTLYNWKKETGVREILTKLIALFYWPNPDSSFSLNKANELKNDFPLYEAKIENFCKKYAKPLKKKKNYNALDWKFNESKNLKIIKIIEPKIDHILLLLNKKEFKDLINGKEYNYDKEKNSEKKLDYLRNQILKYFTKSLNLNLTGKEKKINLSYKNIENDQLGLFCQIEFKNLEEINLSHNKISTMKPLINFKKLKIIDLSYNRIENDFCGLAELLKTNNLLEKINLNNNNLKIGNNIKKALSETKKEMVIINQNININDEKIFKKEDEKEPEKVLVKLNFSINGKSTIILQCNDNELVEDVLKKVCTESGLKYTKILIIYDAKNIKLNQTLRQIGIDGKCGNKILNIITDVTFGFQN